MNKTLYTLTLCAAAMLFGCAPADQDEAWGFKVSCFVDNVYDSVTPMSVARSIRCIQDSE